MASIRDAFEESITDSHSVSKIIFYAIPVFFATMPSITQEQVQLILTVPVSIMLFGFMLHCTSNVRGGKNTVLPSFNIFSVIWAGIKGTVALAPLVILTSLAYFYTAGLLANAPLEPNLINIFNIIIGIIFYSFNFVGYLLYAHKFKITDAYNVKLILQYCMDVLIAMIFMGIFMFIVNVIIVVPVAYIIWLFFGFPNPVIIFYFCMVTVFDAAVMGHYLAQIDYEIIAVAEESDKGTNLT